MQDLAWNGERLAERILERFDGVTAKRNAAGKIVSLYFKQLPTQEQVEVACLGIEGIAKLDSMIQRGLV